MRKLPTRKQMIVVPMMLALLTGACQSSFAQQNSTQLIDREFETALRKFATKRFLNRIDATAEQRSKVNAIVERTVEDTRPLREQLRQGLLDVSALMASKDASDEQIKQKVEELRPLREKIVERRLSTALEVRKILTLEQREKINNRVRDLIAANLRPERKISLLLEE